MPNEDTTVLANVLLALEDILYAPADDDSVTGAIYFTRQHFGGITYYELWIQVADGRKRIITFYSDETIFGGNELRHRMVDMLRSRASKQLRQWIPETIPEEPKNDEGKTIIELDDNEVLALALMTSSKKVSVRDKKPQDSE